MRFVKMSWLNSLRAKVLLAYVASVVLSVLLVVVAIRTIIGTQGYRLSVADIAGAARNMAQDLRFDRDGRPVGFDIDEVNFEWVFESMKQETAYRVLDSSGQVVMASPAGEDFWPADGGVRRLARGSFEFARDGVVMLGATESVERAGQRWFLQFAVSARFMQLTYRAFALPFTRTGIVLFSLVLLFVFAGCAYVMLWHTLRPLRQISDAAAAISTRSLHARLQTDAVPTEIAPLVDSFNRVLERLQHGYRIQQEFLATAAHELKTPLALIRAQIELGRRGEAGCDSLLSDVEYMTRQVQQLLLLAEASEERNYIFAVVGVQEIAHEAVAYLQRMAAAADVRLTVSASASDVQWRADRGALFTLLKNLLENAIHHAPAASAVSVVIENDAVTVRDLGPGVDAGQLPSLFERFWRGAHRRDRGAGLGLAICREIAMAHGWQLSVERAEPGLRFRLANASEDKAASKPG